MHFEARVMIPSTISTIIAIPILGVLVVIQSSIVSRIPLIQGTPDLVLLAILAWALQKKADTVWQWCIIGSLMVTLTSALPMGAVFVGYGLATAIALALRRRIWQIPLLAMFIVTFLGTVILYGFSLLALWLVGNPVPVLAALNLIALPGILLNLLLAIPAYGLLHELANWIYPEEIEV